MSPDTEARLRTLVRRWLAGGAFQIALGLGLMGYLAYKERR
jgi:hypothetical protein